MVDGERSALEQQLLDVLAAIGPAGAGDDAQGIGLDQRLIELFDIQVTSRHCDLAARWLRSRGQGYYTIGSSGHESNAAVAMALRPTDPALLHYRSGGFYLARAGLDGARDILAGVVAAVAEPMAGGRHKVFGRHDLAVIPQTSTIASHLPRALGVAFAIDRAARLGVECPWPTDALAVCSFGDASANHSVATGAVNTATHIAHQRLPLPLLFVCEDNGLGISVRTPSGWIAAAYGSRPDLRYVSVDGDDPTAVLHVTDELAGWVRATRRPAFLHLRTVRFGGHAGTDVETAYRSAAERRADIDRDPIVGTARQLLAGGAITAQHLLDRHDQLRSTVYAIADQVAEWAQLETADQVMAPLAPRRPAMVAARAVTGSSIATAAAEPGTAAAEPGTAAAEPGTPAAEPGTPAAEPGTPAAEPGTPAAEPITMAQAINRTLGELLDADPRVLIFGEDIAVKGGVYGVTKGLLARAGAARVFDTLLDETSILGLALGAAISGFVPIPEIQYLAYLHNAEDQLRGEAATLSFFSQGQYRNGLVVRVAGYGYQEGFGGHFHNDDAIAVLRDIPGLVVATPARADDAAAVLRTCVAAATVDGTVSVIVEPIARYHTADLYEPGDRAWLATPDTDQHVPIGSARTYGDGTDLTIVTSGNGVYLSLRVARKLDQQGIAVRVVDLRWIAPLPVADIVREAAATGAVLVADETRASGGISEGVVTALVDAGFTGRLARVTSHDSFVPLGAAAKLVLLSENEIAAAAVRLVRGTSGGPPVA